jgi:hypothetical protein
MKQENIRFTLIQEPPPEPLRTTLKATFGADYDNNIIFTIGDKIYAKNGLPLDLVVHETTHVHQQTRRNINPTIWWDRYIADPQFRLIQELEAYQNQYQYVIETHKDRNTRAKALSQFARDLSSPIYGNVITYNEALKRIKQV